MEYIKSMRGVLMRARGYGSNGYELAVEVCFDASQFNRIKKTQCPLGAGMAQIKNVVFDACGVRGIPGYSRPTMRQPFPRASKGLVKLTVYFDVSEYTARQLTGLDLKPWTALHHAVELQSVLEATRADGHLFAKTAIASRMGN